MVKSVDMLFEFKNTIQNAPVGVEKMHEMACSNDKITIDTWRPIWIKNVRHTKEKFKSFTDYGIGQIYGSNDKRPCIVVGSGPSLKNNIKTLKEVKNIPILSCLHNYHYMVDNEINVTYYVSLDAGPVVIEEICEGGKKTAEEYLESTKDKTLIAFIGSDPSLWESWRGKVILFNSPIPDQGFRDAVKEIEPFYSYVSTGGNVLGACTYIAKAIMGSNPIIFCGADFCFSYTRKFHPWDSKYDAKIGEATRCVDVWGNSVLTWQSYYNFKLWFDWVCTNVPGIYINCTEGGLMGSYPEGNIASIAQMTLDDCLYMYGMYEKVSEQFTNPSVESETYLALF